MPEFKTTILSDSIKDTLKGVSDITKLTNNTIADSLVDINPGIRYADILGKSGIDSMHITHRLLSQDTQFHFQ